jgi:hypothetical protein
LSLLLRRQPLKVLEQLPSPMVEPFGLLPSLDNGGPEARLRSASRILSRNAFESVATSMSQWLLDSSSLSATPSPNHSGRVSAEPRERRPPYTVRAWCQHCTSYAPAIHSHPALTLADGLRQAITPSSRLQPSRTSMTRITTVPTVENASTPLDCRSSSYENTSATPFHWRRSRIAYDASTAARAKSSSHSWRRIKRRVTSRICLAGRLVDESHSGIDSGSGWWSHLEEILPISGRASRSAAFPY